VAIEAGIDALEDIVGNGDVSRMAFDEVDDGRRIQEQARDILESGSDFSLIRP
jgi:hypothetical protein